MLRSCRSSRAIQRALVQYERRDAVTVCAACVSCDAARLVGLHRLRLVQPFLSQERAIEM